MHRSRTSSSQLGYKSEMLGSVLELGHSIGSFYRCHLISLPIPVPHSYKTLESQLTQPGRDQLSKGLFHVYWHTSKNSRIRPPRTPFQSSNVHICCPTDFTQPAICPDSPTPTTDLDSRGLFDYGDAPYSQLNVFTETDHIINTLFLYTINTTTLLNVVSTSAHPHFVNLALMDRRGFFSTLLIIIACLISAHNLNVHTPSHGVCSLHEGTE